MARLCLRCKKALLPVEERYTENVVTHGLCVSCMDLLTLDVPASVKELLDIIIEPVFVLDNQGIVKTANDSGLRLLGKDSGSVEGYLGGNVFGCAFANLPEGCGRTEYCKTCAIRNIVMDTLAFGRGYTNVPAFQNIRTPNGNRIMRFNVSTERLDNYILLRIDDVTERAVV